jgi:hypothetical protein
MGGSDLPSTGLVDAAHSVSGGAPVALSGLNVCH